VNPDDILDQLRDLASNATRAAKNPSACSDRHCAHRYRAETMAARIAELDASLSHGGILPTAWASPLIPAQRLKRY
jgi:hypothetical protein